MSEKTELPTPQRLRKAREDGQVPYSKDFTQTVLVASLFGYMLVASDTLVRGFAEMMLMPASVIGMEFEQAVNSVATQLLRRGAKLLAPFIGIVLVVGLLADATQTGMNISFKALKPSGKKLDVVANAKNMFSAKSLFEFVKSNLKIALLSAILYFSLRSALPVLLTVPRGGVEAVGIATVVLMKTIVLSVSIGYFAIAVADLVWQRFQYVRQLKMSIDEVKQEYKEAEGDPHIKHKRRELHRELLQGNELDRTRKASVVVTNPTHLAVAIAYEKEVTPLPVVVAMGEGLHAFRIAAIAREHGIPVLQNIPLARGLMATATLNEYIPSDLIEPVAQVLRLVLEMKETEE